MNACRAKRMSSKTSGWLLLGLLASTCAQAENRAEDRADRPRLQEITDAELAAMRGRYTLAGNAVAWFGVSLISQWHSADGQQLNAGLQLNFDLRSGRPRFSYQPTISIGYDDSSSVALNGGSVRHIDSAGLANVDGFVQAVQLAGDGNRVSNQALLIVRDGNPGEAGAEQGPLALDQQAGPASVQAYVDGQRAGVLLQLAGQGQVRQWLGNGQIGQAVALGTDGSWVSNQLRMEVVRTPMSNGVSLTQNVAQALASSRGLGPIGGP